MPAKKRSADKKADQLQRFREAAKKAEADESGAAFDKAMSAVLPKFRKERTFRK
jgi:hypothetical protein